MDENAIPPNIRSCISQLNSFFQTFPKNEKSPGLSDIQESSKPSETLSQSPTPVFYTVHGTQDGNAELLPNEPSDSNDISYSD